MFGSDLYIALILGVLLSLIFAEKQGSCRQDWLYRDI